MEELLYAALGPSPFSGLAAAFLFVNAAAAMAIVAVAMARIPARYAFGAEAAYHLWLLPPAIAFLAVLAVFMPADSETLSAAARLAARAPQLALLWPVWAAGAMFLALRFGVAQARFLRDVETGRAGPAVVGLISPRIVLPADDGAYTAEERELIRAHERAHVARKDPRAAALASLAQCAAWFNPFAHLAVHLIRLDQELACDAAVMMRRPHARALYAKTLLKTQLAATPLPFGCYWPARGRHPLEVRVALLKPRDGKGRSVGPGIVAASVDAIRP